MNAPAPALADLTRAAPTAAEPDPLWYKDAIIYQLHVKAFFDSNGDGIGDFAGLIAEARLHPGARRHHASGCCRSIRRRCATTATTSPTTAASIRPTARSRTSGDFVREAHRARPAGHHRAGHQPHLRPAPVVPARARRAARLAGARLLRVERRPTRSTRARGSSSPTPRRRTGPGTRSPGRTSGIASSATSRTSTSTTRRCMKAVLQRHALLARHGRRRPAARRDSVPGRARGHELREPARDARGAEAHPRGDRRAVSRTACCSPRPTSGRRTCARTSATATNATWRSTSR